MLKILKSRHLVRKEILISIKLPDHSNELLCKLVKKGKKSIKKYSTLSDHKMAMI